MIRQATATDAENIEQLIQPYINDFVVDELGFDKFSAYFIRQLIESPEIHYWVLEQDGRIIGVIAYRQPAHIVHFFVEAQSQGRGLGKQLWDHLYAQISQNPIEMITVNSSCYAQPIYEHLGFVCVGTVKEMQGIRFIRMQKKMNGIEL